MNMKSNNRGSNQADQEDSSTRNKQAGSHEQQVKAGQQSHKNDNASASKRGSSTPSTRSK